jgi:4-hydroxy-tetrahydrodipicolinate reductase
VSEVLADACRRGGSTFYGTGMNPGLCQILGIVHSTDVSELENVTVVESVDVSCHHSADTWREVGYGRPVDDPELPAMLEKYTRVFADAVHLMADCFDLRLDDVTFSYELGACTKDVDLGWYQLPAGSLGANYLKYQGVVDGVPRIEAHLEWQMTPHTDPRWNIQGCYITKIQADPVIYSKHLILPKPGTDFSSAAAFASVGMTVTGMPALNAIRSVVAAPPGVITSADLPLRTFAGRFKREVARGR